MSQNRLQLFYCDKLWKLTFIALEIVGPEFRIHSYIRTAIVQNSSATCTTLWTENPLLWASIRFSEMGRSHRERALANRMGVQAQWFFYLLKTASPTKRCRWRKIHPFLFHAFSSFCQHFDLVSPIYRLAHSLSTLLSQYPSCWRKPWTVNDLYVLSSVLETTCIALTVSCGLRRSNKTEWC